MPSQLTQTQLLEMGWTKNMIKTLLPPPTLRPNPMYKKAAPMKLWDEMDVKSIMETDAFTVEKVRAERRRLASQKAFLTKTDNLRNEIAKAIQTISVVIIPEDRLYRQTLKSKQSWYDSSYLSYNNREYRCAASADKNTIERWIVNYIRHELTTYDSGLNLLNNKTGKFEIYPELRNAILLKIAEAYPLHKDECFRQMVGTCSSLNEQIESASTRAAESQASSHVTAKEPEREI